MYGGATMAAAAAAAAASHTPNRSKVIHITKGVTVCNLLLCYSSSLCYACVIANVYWAV